MSENAIPILASYDEVKTEVWESDLILLKNNKGESTRALKAVWWDGELFCIEVRKYRGVTVIPLKQLVLSHPGKIEIFEVNPQNRWENYDRHGSARHLKRIQRSLQDWRIVLVDGLKNLFSVLWPKATDENMPGLYGAEAIRVAERLGGGVEPVSEHTNKRITVADLEVSPLYRYRFTLK